MTGTLVPVAPIGCYRSEIVPVATMISSAWLCGLDHLVTTADIVCPAGEFYPPPTSLTPAPPPPPVHTPAILALN